LINLCLFEFIEILFDLLLEENGRWKMKAKNKIEKDIKNKK